MTQSYWPAVFRRLPDDFVITMFDAEIAASSSLQHAMRVLVRGEPVNVSARLVWQLSYLTCENFEGNGQAALAAIRALARVQIVLRRRVRGATRALAEIWPADQRGNISPWPRSGGRTTFKLSDGTTVTLADWIDDRTCSTVSFGPASATPAFTVAAVRTVRAVPSVVVAPVRCAGASQRAPPARARRRTRRSRGRRDL